MRQAKLGDFLAKRTRGIVPASTPDETFELYSVPAFGGRRPEVVTGGQIGSNKQLVDPGSVLLCKINPRINRAWTVGSFTKHQKIASTEWITFPPHPDFEPQYLAHYLSRKEIRDYLAANASGVGGSLMRVKASTVEDLPLPLPDVDEQRRIVAELEKQFSRLEKSGATLQCAVAGMSLYRSSVLESAIRGLLVAESAAAHISRLDQLIGPIHQGWSPKCDLQREPRPDEWAVVTTTAVQPMMYVDNQGKPLPTELEPRPRLEIQPGDFLVTRKGPRARAGVACLVRRTRRRLMVCDTVYRFRCDESKIDAAYLEIALNAPSVVQAIDRQKAGINESGVSLTHEKLGGIQIPVPNHDAQLRIIAEVDRRLSVIREVEAEVDANLKRANVLRQSILASAFR